MIYKAKFVGRRINATGKFYQIEAIVFGNDEESARINLYNRYDHISGLVLEPYESVAEKCAAWLLTCPNVVASRPVVMTMFNVDYEGVLYTLHETFQATERAVTDGPMEDGETRIETRLYVLGKMPKQLDKGHHCFQWASGLPINDRMENHTDEWYVACYSSTDPQYAWASPFGPSIVMRECTSANFGYYKDHKIDTLETYQYKRHPLHVECLTPA